MVDEKRYFSGLYCIVCQLDFEEDGKGVFRCRKCKFEVGVLQ